MYCSGHAAPGVRGDDLGWGDGEWSLDDVEEDDTNEEELPLVHLTVTPPSSPPPSCLGGSTNRRRVSLALSLSGESARPPAPSRNTSMSSLNKGRLAVHIDPRVICVSPRSGSVSTEWMPQKNAQGKVPVPVPPAADALCEHRSDPPSGGESERSGSPDSALSWSGTLLPQSRQSSGGNTAATADSEMEVRPLHGPRGGQLSPKKRAQGPVPMTRASTPPSPSDPSTPPIPCALRCAPIEVTSATDCATAMSSSSTRTVPVSKSSSDSAAVKRAGGRRSPPVLNIPQAARRDARLGGKMPASAMVVRKVGVSQAPADGPLAGTPHPHSHLHAPEFSTSPGSPQSPPTPLDQISAEQQSSAESACTLPSSPLEATQAPLVVQKPRRRNKSPPTLQIPQAARRGARLDKLPVNTTVKKVGCAGAMAMQDDEGSDAPTPGGVTPGGAAPPGDPIAPVPVGTKGRLGSGSVGFWATSSFDDDLGKLCGFELSSSGGASPTPHVEEAPKECGGAPQPPAPPPKRRKQKSPPALSIPKAARRDARLDKLPAAAVVRVGSTPTTPATGGACNRLAATTPSPSAGGPVGGWWGDGADLAPGEESLQRCGS
eukprot:TRINITY_DN14932_c0_g1_i1.p1 TRINITY_DN14932_c0_g1~~TRINITY_DN14932_c0_g1_i1.p1  ORF type:complete len:642 (+),score=148.66 TRINITY_DN14932_c0_g1_i1:121-1926(+)